MLQLVARDIFGAPNVNVTKPSWLDGGWSVRDDPALHPPFILGLVVAAVTAIWLYQTRLPQGRRMRAVMQNRQLAACSGIDTQKVDRRTFFIGSGLAGAAGVALTLLGPIGPSLGTNYIVDAFLVVVAGGLGQIRGTVLAAVFLGVLAAVVEFETQASLAKVAVFVAVVALLQPPPPPRARTTSSCSTPRRRPGCPHPHCGTPPGPRAGSSCGPRPLCCPAGLRSPTDTMRSRSD